MANDAMRDVQEKLAALLEAARTGAIIPIRLPAQIEEIQQAVDAAQKASQKELEEAQQAATLSGDAGEIIREYAEFIKTAVHELRTPMTSIRGYSDMLNNTQMSGDLNDKQAQMLAVIRTNTRRMEGLISDLSYINKIRAQILPINANIDLVKNIVQMAEKKLRPLANELGRTLEIEMPQGLPLLNTDGEHLAHAIVKLAENGLRYSDETTGKVRIYGLAEGALARIVIEDNGIGMTEAELAQLGEVYFRSDNDVVRNYKGSGLGVAIAFGIIRLLGAQVHVNSKPGEGSRFTIEIHGTA